jgi:hypothetical protein
MSEADLQAAVIDLARILGLLIYHTRDSRGSAAGFPDLFIIGPRGDLFAELKSASGQLTRPQGLWRDGLTDAVRSCPSCHCEIPATRWVLWRPEDWYSGQIMTELRGLCARLDRGGES